MGITFFEAPADFRRWLSEHHAEADELWVGYYKKATGKPSLTWPESRDEALCWGWIDGIRKSIDDEAYRVRFTPRRPGSHWSKVNLERVAVLMEEGRMARPGIEAYEARGRSSLPAIGSRRCGGSSARGARRRVRVVWRR